MKGQRPNEAELREHAERWLDSAPGYIRQYLDILYGQRRERACSEGRSAWYDCAHEREGEDLRAENAKLRKVAEAARAWDRRIDWTASPRPEIEDPEWELHDALMGVFEPAGPSPSQLATWVQEYLDREVAANRLGVSDIEILTEAAFVLGSRPSACALEPEARPAPKPSCGWCRGNPIGDCAICQARPSTQETYADDAPASSSESKCAFCAPGADPWNDPHGPIAQVRAEERAIGKRYRDFVHEIASRDHDEGCTEDSPCIVCDASDCVMGFGRWSAEVPK